MASISVRDISETIKARLAAQAAHEGKSLEAHVRDILKSATGVGPDASVLMAIYRFSLECRSRLTAGETFPERSYFALYQAVAAAAEAENGIASGILKKLAVSGDGLEGWEIEAAFMDLHQAGVLAFPDAAVIGMTLGCLHDLRSSGAKLGPVLESLMARSAEAMERIAAPVSANALRR
ncbi:hypothetical protein V5F50_19880 [Xanthobacter sp. V13C-7B]|uniref:FitA-like ribbon-helix-helix domain-containing protein n=1 Tax=Xanthobacter variabilis TaxID=3119932 RepID=UPI00372752D4